MTVQGTPYRKPNVKRFGEKDKRILHMVSAYTRIRKIGREWEAWLMVDVQHFKFDSRLAKREAEWVCWMLAKALAGIQSYCSRKIVRAMRSYRKARPYAKAVWQGGYVLPVGP